jgi:hypothetical protein
LPISLYSITFFRKPSTNVPTGSFASCAGVGQSTFAVETGGLGISGVFGSSGASGGSTFGGGDVVVIVISSGE